MTSTSVGAIHPVNPVINPLVHARPGRGHSLISRLLSPGPDFSLCLQNDEQRSAAEQFIHERFEASFGASLNEYFPALMTMRCFDNLSGAAGIRPAASTPLFLENYLDQPVEDLLSARMGTDIMRSDLVEIGNLVSSQRGASHILFLIFTSMLYQAGYRWIVFTATKALRNNLCKLGFEFTYLSDADPAVLDEESQLNWGDYYSTQPQVLAGNLADAVEIIQSRPLFRRVYRLYRHKINYLTREFQAAQGVQSTK